MKLRHPTEVPDEAIQVARLEAQGVSGILTFSNAPVRLASL
jgi:hypothetical protein